MTKGSTRFKGISSTSVKRESTRSPIASVAIHQAMRGAAPLHRDAVGIPGHRFVEIGLHGRVGLHGLESASRFGLDPLTG